MSGTVRYCYAVTRGLSPEALTDERGVRGTPLEAVEADGLVAVTSPVDADEFSESALQKSLEDLNWLGEVARAHNSVVERVAGLAVTLPLRLATIYLDADRVRSVLRSEEAAWTAALDRLDGRVEWGVKVYTVEQPEPAAPEPERPASGRSYLRQRLQARDSRDASMQDATGSAEDVDGSLSALAHEHHRHRVQAQELSGVEGQNVLNAAYLVDADAQDAFLDRVTELREQHTRCRIDVTGPWAPYSFAFDHTTSDAG
ncbi:gas vesicle protein [Allosaccharopolyspora coralli]|uniref:Gas vesicle protein n=1 Tax=Allosaccharopolyspora coralli TaxID=2665642 RepID=A0A5Q3QD99_9PSEU|nr:GvpL/GvpF family gas vesicle protein [Allosaccharopolyspora coralli]QGK71336.1 gas vesicle protein [Allosaccharopolyspora coralli]